MSANKLQIQMGVLMITEAVESEVPGAAPYRHTGANAAGPTTGRCAKPPPRYPGEPPHKLRRYRMLKLTLCKRPTRADSSMAALSL